MSGPALTSQQRQSLTNASRCKRGDGPWQYEASRGNVRTARALVKAGMLTDLRESGRGVWFATLTPAGIEAAGLPADPTPPAS